MSFFDELGDDRPDKINVKPFHTVKDKDDIKKHILPSFTKKIFKSIIRY